MPAETAAAALLLGVLLLMCLASAARGTPRFAWVEDLLILLGGCAVVGVWPAVFPTLVHGTGGFVALPSLPL